jgi:hypothetical protein
MTQMGYAGWRFAIFSRFSEISLAGQSIFGINRNARLIIWAAKNYLRKPSPDLGVQ